MLKQRTWLERASLIGRAGCGLALIVTISLANASPPGDAEEDGNQLFRAPWNGEVLGTGAKRPNAAQWAWGEANMVKTKNVRMNPIGLYRANEARAARGLKKLTDEEADLAAFGQEVSAAPSNKTQPTTTSEAPGVLPSYVDNSALPYFPPIRSQGSLNSCGQFSAVYYTLTHMTALARNWDAKTGGDTLRFSPKWTYNVLNGGGNNGTWHYDAYAIAMKHGLATWAEFPYDSDYRGWCLNPTAWRNALYVRADSTGKVLDVDSETGLSQLKQLLNNGYVLNFATYINSWVWKSIANDPSTAADDAFTGKNCVLLVNGLEGGHAMTIVGYNDDIWVDLNGDGAVAASEKGALRIANSWGTGWGEAGYCWLSYNAIRTRNAAKTSEGIFWYDEACWVTARTTYAPKLIAEFTLNHLKRNQLVMTLGTSDLGSTAPKTYWYTSRVLSSAGGAYAFDGSMTARNGTFCLDLTDLVPSSGGALRFYVGMRDTATGDSAWMGSATLVDLVHGTEVATLPAQQYADGSQAYAYADYDTGSGVLPPVAYAAAEPTSGDVVLPVVFDGSASTSPSGSVVSYQWDFGDGATGSGPTIQHSYAKAGKFMAKLTVYDSAGGSSSSSVEITANDPNLINAPSNLAGKASGRAITLTWTDSSQNETGFVIERGTKLAKTLTFEVVGATAANATSFADTVPAGGSYYYRVQAVNTTTGSVSPYSNQISMRVK